MNDRLRHAVEIVCFSRAYSQPNPSIQNSGGSGSNAYIQIYLQRLLCRSRMHPVRMCIGAHHVDT